MKGSRQGHSNEGITAITNHTPARRIYKTGVSGSLTRCRLYLKVFAIVGIKQSTSCSNFSSIPQDFKHDRAKLWSVSKENGRKMGTENRKNQREDGDNEVAGDKS